MSSEALAWAFKQDCKSSSVKFTLVALCECANYRTGRITPSIDHICEITGQNRKTVINNIAELERQGIIADTGERVGRTKQIKVYQANLTTGAQTSSSETHYVYRLTNATGLYYVGVRSCLGEPSQDNYMGSGRWPQMCAFKGIALTKEILSQHDSRHAADVVEALTIKACIGDERCMNIEYKDTEKGIPETAPFTEEQSRFSPKQSQKRDTEPSLEPSSKNTQKRASLISDDWKPRQFTPGSKSAGIISGWSPDELETNIEHFIAHHQAKRTTAADWQPWWKTWTLNSKNFGARNGRSNVTAFRQIGASGPDKRNSLTRACDEALDYLG